MRDGLRLFGSFEAMQNGRTIEFAYRGASQVLAYLALQGASSRVDVARALWPLSSRAAALTNLRQALQTLRRAGCGEWLDVSRSELELSDAVHHDVRDAEAAIEAGQSESLLPLLSQPLLSNWNGAWIEPHRTRWAVIAEKLGSKEPIQPPSHLLEAQRGFFPLFSWLRDHQPDHAIGIAILSANVLVGVSPRKLVDEIGPVLERLEQFPPHAGPLVDVFARAHYMLGDAQAAFELYGKMSASYAARGVWSEMLRSRLSQAVVLRESGLTYEAVQVAEACLAEGRRLQEGLMSDYADYHAGFSQYHHGEMKGLERAIAASHRLAQSPLSISRLFPPLNLALHDEGRHQEASVQYDVGKSLAYKFGDRLGLMTVSLIEFMASAADGVKHDSLFDPLLQLAERAEEANFLTFRVHVLERLARLLGLHGDMASAAKTMRDANFIRARLNHQRTATTRRHLQAAGLSEFLS